jgi:hypothetical protein
MTNTAPPQRMATSTLRLSEYARKFTYPSSIRRTVWTRVEAKGRELGLGFDWWQSQLGTVCLGYGDDGRYVATVGGIGMSIPRQVGKTYFVLALLVVMCILFPGLQVVWTAHHLRTSTKTFTALRGICRRKKVAPTVRAMRSANGEQQVEFVNGSMIMFGARSQGFGRGFDEIDVEVFDEAQIMDTKALEDMIAATNQARHEHGALLFFMGTPPRQTDPSEAFSQRRDEAWSGEDAGGAIWLEIGADPLSGPNDESQWPLMNPSYPLRTPHESMLRLRKNLKDDDSWNREGRGIWDPVAGSHEFDPFSAQGWSDTAQDVHPDGLPQFFVTVAKGQRSAFIAAAASHEGRPHVGVAGHAPGVMWLTAKVRELHERFPNAAFGAYAAGPVKSWAPTFAEFGVELELLTVPDTGSAFAHLKKAVDDRAMTHSPSEVLVESLAGAVWRETDGGGFVLDWRKSEGDPAPFAAVAGALWMLERDPVYDVLASVW